MKIAIDIDDTLTNSFEYFMPFVAEFFNVPTEELKKRNISYSNFPDEWKPRELEFCKKYYDDTVAGTPFKENAVQTVNRLKKEGHEIYIVTARTNDFYTDAIDTTKEELDRNGLLYDHVVCTFDKAGYCQKNKIDLFIDDSVKNCSLVSKVGVKTLLFNSPANAGAITDCERVGDWDSVYKKVEEMKKARREIF